MSKLPSFLLNSSAHPANIVKTKQQAVVKSCTAATASTWADWEQPAPGPRQLGQQGKVRHQVKISLSYKANAKGPGALQTLCKQPALQALSFCR